MGAIAVVATLDGRAVNRADFRHLLEQVGRGSRDLDHLFAAADPLTAGTRSARQAERRAPSVALGGAVWPGTETPRVPRAATFASTDGLVVAADARLDDREPLIERLLASGEAFGQPPSDAELIAAAYRTWGRNCVDRLLGDFAFALWDDGRSRLFCARDFFGIRPLSYAMIPGGVAVASSIDALLTWPGVDTALDESTILDTLLFGEPIEPDATTYTGIRRLAAGHHLTFDRSGLRVWKYRRLPTTGRIRYRNPRDYVAEYLRLLERAVCDRLPSGSASVLMSGGTDSTAIAVLAQRAAAEHGGDVRAFTLQHEELIRGDEEGAFARRAADHAGLAVEVVTDQAARPWEPMPWSLPQPVDNPYSALWFDFQALAAQHSPVVLAGYGGDPLLTGDPAWLGRRLRRGRLASALGAIATYFWFNRTLRGLGLRNLYRAGQGTEWTFPEWIRPDVATRAGLRDRFVEVLGAWDRDTEHSRAYLALDDSSWARHFEFDHPSDLRIEKRYPLFDLRLVRFVLAIPPTPWSRNKTIHRAAMRGLLPESVRTRPKSPLPEGSLRAGLARTRLGELALDLPRMREWVDPACYREALLAIYHGARPTVPTITAPLSLEQWFAHAAGRRVCPADRVSSEPGVPK